MVRGSMLIGNQCLYTIAIPSVSNICWSYNIVIHRDFTIIWYSQFRFDGQRDEATMINIIISFVCVVATRLLYYIFLYWRFLFFYKLLKKKTTKGNFVFEFTSNNLFAVRRQNNAHAIFRITSFIANPITLHNGTRFQLSPL